MLLQASDDIEQIRRGRIALRPEHLVKRLYMNSRLLRQRGKAEGRINEVAQNLAAQSSLARQQRFDGVAQQPAPKLLIAPHPRLHRLPKIPCQRHLFDSNIYVPIPPTCEVLKVPLRLGIHRNQQRQRLRHNLHAHRESTQDFSIRLDEDLRGRIIAGAALYADSLKQLNLA
jgi:hypothetical protein